MSQPPRSNRGNRERNGGQRPPRDDRRSSPDRSSSQPPYYPQESERPPKHQRDAPRVEHQDSKCSNICSRRGIVLICAVLTNALVLICVIAAHMASSGISAMGGMNSLSINSNFNMQGPELQQARDLDMQYSQMRAPALYGGIPFSLTLGVISLLFTVAGNKPPHRMSQKLLVGQLLFQAVASVVYMVAVGLYLHFVIMVNSSDVCKKREILYTRNGYTWMNCNVSGADAAVALFGLFTAILYVAGTVLTFQTIRGVKRYLQEKKKHEEERHQARGNPQRTPLWAETTSV